VSLRDRIIVVKLWSEMSDYGQLNSQQNQTADGLVSSKKQYK
jgi:hypothetical protein